MPKPEAPLVVEINDETRPALARIALAQYADEPCRICGELLSMDALQTAVFAGYSSDSTSRAAHKECWDAGIPQEKWAKQ